MDPNAIVESWKDPNTLLSNRREQDPNSIVNSWQTPDPQDAPVVPEAVDYSKTDYTVSDLTQDEFYSPILKYMSSRFGTHMEDKDRDEVVSQYINNMRGFSGGNTVRAVGEINYLSSLEDDQAKVAGEAYTIFENLPNIFSEKASWSDTLDGTWDYTRAAVLDPANLLGGLIGKGVTSAGFKSGAVGANVIAKKAYQSALTKGVAQGLTKEAAETGAKRAASKVFKSTLEQITKDQAASAITREATATTVKNSVVKRLISKEALVESGTMAMVDAIAAGATDYAYQSALEQTGVTDDVSLTQSALVATATLVAGGVIWSAQGLFKRSGATVGPDLEQLKVQRSGARLSGIGEGMSEAVTKGRTGPASEWIDDVLAGKELKDLDVSFWETFMNGNDELGLKGVKQTLVDQGYVWVAKDENDNITNYIGDIIKEADPTDFKKFINDFSASTGNPMSDLKALTQEEFANTFKKKISDSARLTNLMRQASDALGIDKSKLSKADIFDYLNGDAQGKFEAYMSNVAKRKVPLAQNQLIRLLVSNLSTTQLNLLGWSAASALDSATDLVTAAVQAPFAMLKRDGAGLKQAGVLATQSFRKLQNTLDPNTTYDQFLKYAQARPDAMKELTNIMSGGVEQTRKLYDEMDLSRSFTGMRADQAVDFVQNLSLVRAQDSYTKSIEFMTELDKRLRMPTSKGGFGMSYKEFMAQDDYWIKMNTPEFRNAETKAVTTALDNVFSRSYGKMGGSLGDVADFIENTRNIPGVGVLLPFGRFFNNTIAFMSDYSGMSLMGRLAGLNSKSSETTGRLWARTAVGLTLIGTLAQREAGYAGMGLTWDEQPTLGDATGAITSEKYNFPYAFFKGAARIVALKQQGKEVPREMVTDILKTVGPESFTREFTESFGEGGETIITMLTEDEAALDIFLGIAGKMAGKAASSATRFAEPINSVFGMAQGRDRIVPDRRQGNPVVNEATRYIDNIVGIFDEDKEQRYIASRGALRPQDTKFIAPVREVKVTNMSRLAAQVGIPEWDKLITMVGKDAPVASNRYAKLYNDINETRAGRLIRSEEFINGNLEVKTELAKDLIIENKEMVKEVMEADVQGDDPLLLKRAEIQNRARDVDIRKATEELGLGDRELDSMSLQELLLLESALDFRKEILLGR